MNIKMIALHAASGYLLAESSEKSVKMSIMRTPSKQTTPGMQARNPLHGMTLEAILTALVTHFGWVGLGERISLRCFTHDPSMSSSLKFLRKTPWAREKVQGLYLFMLREQRRQQG